MVNSEQYIFNCKADCKMEMMRHLGTDLPGGNEIFFVGFW